MRSLRGLLSTQNRVCMGMVHDRCHRPNRLKRKSMWWGGLWPKQGDEGMELVTEERDS